MTTAPNTTYGASNPDVVTGGVFGAILGNLPTEPVGFYGNPGVAQQSGKGITTVAQLVAALQATGLLGA